MLDVDRLAEAVLEGTRVLLAKEMAPLLVANAELRAANEALKADGVAMASKLAELEGMVRSAPEPLTLEDIEKAVAQANPAIEVREPEDLRERIAQAVAEAVQRGLEGLPAIEVTRADVDAVRASVEALRAVEPMVEIREPTDLDVRIAHAAREAVQRGLADAPCRDDLFAVREAVAELRGRVDGIRLPEVVNGKDGRSIASVKVNDEGDLVVKFSNGETEVAGPVCGKDGKDAFEIGALQMEFDGERSFTVGWPDGRKQMFQLPVPIYRGVWSEGEYKRGDTVTWGGSQFTAIRDTDAKPEMDGSWQLSVKRGRDGREVVKTERKPEPVKIGGGDAG